MSNIKQVIKSKISICEKLMEELDDIMGDSGLDMTDEQVSLLVDAMYARSVKETNDLWLKFISTLTVEQRLKICMALDTAFCDEYKEAFISMALAVRVFIGLDREQCMPPIDEVHKSVVSDLLFKC